jgi:hypothetical protein
MLVIRLITLGHRRQGRRQRSRIDRLLAVKLAGRAEEGLKRGGGAGLGGKVGVVSALGTEQLGRKGNRGRKKGVERG